MEDFHWKSLFWNSISKSVNKIIITVRDTQIKFSTCFSCFRPADLYSYECVLVSIRTQISCSKTTEASSELDLLVTGVKSVQLRYIIP